MPRNNYDDLALLKENTLYQKRAKAFLSKSRLLTFLNSFGETQVCGSYAAGLMMHGDVDIKVIGSRAFTSEKVLNIFNQLYCSGKFISYFIGGDWNNPKIGKEFPNGKYIGLKQKIAGETWKFDIWFIDKKENQRLKNGFDICNADLSQKQRLDILKLKKIRKTKNLNITGQDIYHTVLGS